MIFNQYLNQDEQINALSKSIIDSLNTNIAKKGSTVIAVSGGKSPIMLFQKLSQTNLEWDKVTIVLVDERFLDTQDADSNEKLVRDKLLINNAVMANFIGLVTTRNIISSAANANIQIPNIDIALLGMGEDGHTASIFPCCPEINTIIDTELTKVRYTVTTPTNAPHKRIGLSLYALLEIPNLFLSINNENKLNIINQAKDKTSLNYPISYIINNRPDLQIFWYK
jgi:6-phosphogluconolactonase